MSPQRGFFYAFARAFCEKGTFWYNRKGATFQ